MKRHTGLGVGAVALVALPAMGSAAAMPRADRSRVVITARADDGAAPDAAISTFLRCAPAPGIAPGRRLRAHNAARGRTPETSNE